MKFFTFAIMPKGIQVNDSNAIETYITNAFEPHRLIEDDDLPYNSNWKVDYYLLYDQKEMARMEFTSPLYSEICSDSGYVVYPCEKFKEDIVPFAILKPNGEWLNGSYPLEKEDVTWPARAIGIVKEYTGHMGVYVYCHS